MDISCEGLLLNSFCRLCSIVPDETWDSSEIGFASIWVTRFWPPESVQGDRTFGGGGFQQYLKSHCVSYRPTLSRHHDKSTMEPENGILRTIFLRLRSMPSEALSEMHALPAVPNSNHLYDSDTLPAFELSKVLSSFCLQTPSLDQSFKNLLTLAVPLYKKGEYHPKISSHCRLFCQRR